MASASNRTWQHNNHSHFVAMVSVLRAIICSWGVVLEVDPFAVTLTVGCVGVQCMCGYVRVWGEGWREKRSHCPQHSLKIDTMVVEMCLWGNRMCFVLPFTMVVWHHLLFQDQNCGELIVIILWCYMGEHQHHWHIDVHDDENFHTYVKCEVKNKMGYGDGAFMT